MRELHYYVACSVDGFIARKDGSLDGFPHDDDVVSDYLSSLKHYDVVLMGRKTYEYGLNLGVTDPYPHLESYVVSRTMTESPDQRVQLVKENPAALARELKQREGKPIYLCGGAELAAALFEEKLIDRLILKINPFLMGQGVPLFSGAIPFTQLELTKSQTYTNGSVWLNYRVMV